MIVYAPIIAYPQSMRKVLLLLATMIVLLSGCQVTEQHLLQRALLQLRLTTPGSTSGIHQAVVLTPVHTPSMQPADSPMVNLHPLLK